MELQQLVCWIKPSYLVDLMGKSGTQVNGARGEAVGATGGHKEKKGGEAIQS